MNKFPVTKGIPFIAKKVEKVPEIEESDTEFDEVDE